jgi:S-(hydroxymethyl)glutathione dehydrogenase/alcohol dehydrogenase
MKTKAAVLRQLNKPLEILELTLPSLEKGQVLVKVAYSGLCHTQLNEIEGKKGPDAYLPHTLGHEGSGVVVKIGEGVEKVSQGDSVVLSWIKGSGLDVKGPTYFHGSEKINSGPISTFMEYTIVSENRLTKIPSGFCYKQASLLGCAIPTGGGIVRHDMQMVKDSSIAIFGVGGIGLSALLTAKQIGANPIIAIDINESKLQMAKSFGATYCINAKEVDVVKEIYSLTQGRGVDFALEAVGVPKIIEDSFQSVKNFGGLCVVAGNVSLNERIAIDPYDLIKGKKIIGSWGGGSKPDEDIPQYVKWASSGLLPLENLITHTFSLDKVNEAFKVLKEGLAGRVVLQL